MAPRAYTNRIVLIVTLDTFFNIRSDGNELPNKIKAYTNIYRVIPSEKRLILKMFNLVNVAQVHLEWSNIISGPSLY